MTTPEQQLAEVRAKRAKLAAEREARAAATAVEDELARESMALANEEAMAKAEAEHGPLGKRIRALDTDLGVVILKRPDHRHFKRFQDAGQVTTLELEKLVGPCIVHPSRERWDEMLTEQPALLMRAGNVVAELAGVRMQETAGK